MIQDCGVCYDYYGCCRCCVVVILLAVISLVVRIVVVARVGARRVRCSFCVVTRGVMLALVS